MKRNIQLFIFFGTLLLLVSSCVKDNFDFDKWDKEVALQPSLAAPIAWGDLSVLEAMNAYDSAGQVIVNEYGFASLLYTTRVKSSDVSDIIYIPNQQINASVNSSSINFTGFNTPGGEIHFTQNYELGFNMFNSDCEIDSLLLKSGILDIASQCSFQHSVFVDVVFPDIKKNGIPLTLDLSYPPGGSYDTSLGNELNDYNLDMTNTSQGYNGIRVQFDVSIYYSGSDDNSGQLLFDIELKNMDYSRIHGYFGYNTLIFDFDTITIDLFKNEQLNIEDYYFRDPMFRVYYWNSYGIPTNFYFNHMTAFSRIDELEYSLIDQSGTLPLDSLSPYYVSYPLILNETVMDSIILNRDNSNIDDVISRQPKWLSFVAHAHTNPMGVMHNNFATDSSVLEAKIEVELPLWGYLNNFNSSDTSEFDFNDVYESTEMISRLQVRLDIRNGLPLEVLAQLYFVDDDYVILDSLLHGDQELLLSAANVDSDGRVLDFSRKITIVEMDTDRVEQIKNTKHVIYKARVNSTNYSQEELVKIYDDYRILFDMAVEADFNIAVDLDTIN
jgi:hypothetical protein